MATVGKQIAKFLGVSRATLYRYELSGMPVEDLGVRPDAIDKLTRDDLLAGNVDLLDAAGTLLASMPVRRLEVDTSIAGDMLTVEIDADGIDRVDLELDGRPLSSEDIGQNPLSVEIEGATAGQLMRADGYSDGELVASRRVTV